MDSTIHGPGGITPPEGTPPPEIKTLFDRCLSQINKNFEVSAEKGTLPQLTPFVPYDKIGKVIDALSKEPHQT